MILPIAALALLWLLLSRTRVARRLLKRIDSDVSIKMFAIVLVVSALLVLAHGNVWAALCLFGVSLWTLGRGTRTPAASFQSNVSRARSMFVEMEFDPITGRFGGRAIAGPLKGVTLDAMDRRQLEELYSACRRADADGIGLLEPYLHRRFPGWRPAADVHDDAGTRRARFSSRMSKEEAYQILGLRHGASRDDIVRSHRAAMKKWHPDQGGTADLAARANEAKEVLLRRHA